MSRVRVIDVLNHETYLFVVYLRMMAVIPTMLRQNAGGSVNSELELARRKRPWPNFKVLTLSCSN
jgi:hypothetical protein